VNRDSYDIKTLRTVVRNAGRTEPAVSKWSVGMHIHHCCLAATGICRALAESSPPPPASGFSFVTWIVFLMGRIPRGRGKSPEVAVPEEGVTEDQLLTMLDECDRAVSEAERLDSDHWFDHFAFGILKKDRALKLIGIHNRHHLKIISDIVSR
jgi:hypothetical protein